MTDTLSKLLSRLPMTTRLLVAGAVVAGVLWWVLDLYHSARIVELVDSEQTAELASEARRDRLRFDSGLKAHFTLTRLLAASRALARHVEQVQSAPPAAGPVQLVGETTWLPPRSDRRGFPLVNHLLTLDAEGRVREAVSLFGDPLPPEALSVDGRVLTLASEQAHIIGLGGAAHLISVAPAGERGGRLVALSRLDSRFLAQVVGLGAATGHVVVLSNGPTGTVAASSDPDVLAPGTPIAALERDWLVAGMEYFDYGSSEVVASFATVVPRVRVAEAVAPLLSRERAQRTVLAVSLSGLFLAVLAWLAFRLRRIAGRVASITEVAFDQKVPVSHGDELLGLVEQVEVLSAAVFSFRRALEREGAERLALMTEQMAVKAENERLRLLQAVTEVMGVGIIRETAEGPVAENTVMAGFAGQCGGLGPFVAARARGQGDLTVGGSGQPRVFELMTASIDPSLLLVADVTERRRAEEAVHSLALFPAQSPFPVLRVEVGGAVLHANPASEGLLAEWGCAAGRPVPESWRETLREAYGSSRQVQIEMSVGPRVLSLTMVPVAGADYVNIYGADVTDRIVAERALAAVNESLERRVAERTRALAHAKEQAELASRTKTEFLASVSHELRTPLNAIIGFSEVIAGGLFGPVGNSRYQDYANDIVLSGRHLLAVINDILDVAKIEAGQMALSLDPVVVGEVVDAAIRLVEARARANGIRLEAQVMPNLPEVSADRRRLLQILVNLLSNAVKFTPAGGHVQVVAAADAAELILTVADTGIGMDSDQVVTALEPFRQVDGSLARRYEGTGLGLPLSKSFAEMHGGRLDIDSEPGRGTSVRVSLPLALSGAVALSAAD